MPELNTDKATKASGFLAGLFTGWGLPASWAKVLAGAIVGAVAAYFTATVTGCTFSHETTGADGSTSSWHGTLTPLTPAGTTTSKPATVTPATK